MSRRRYRKASPSIASAIVNMPWWISLLIAGIGGWVMAHPSYWSPGPAIVNQVMVGIAPVVAILFLGLATITLWSTGNRRRQRRRFLAAHQSLSAIKQLNWQDFEELIAAAYRQRGYQVKLSPSGADGGVDIHLRWHRENIVFQ